MSADLTAMVQAAIVEGMSNYDGYGDWMELQIAKALLAAGLTVEGYDDEPEALAKDLISLPWGLQLDYWSPEELTAYVMRDLADELILRAAA